MNTCDAAELQGTVENSPAERWFRKSSEKLNPQVDEGYCCDHLWHRSGWINVLQKYMNSNEMVVKYSMILASMWKSVLPFIGAMELKSVDKPGHICGVLH